jgi:hypothetical protein
VSRSGKKSAIFVFAAEIAWAILSSMKPVIGNQPPHFLEILAFHYICTQLWNHNRCWLIPFQHKLTLPKVSTVRKEVMRVFKEEEDDALAAHVRGYTMQGNLLTLFQAESKSLTWKCYM